MVLTHNNILCQKLTITFVFRGTQRLGKRDSSQRATECHVQRALPSGEPAASLFLLEKQRAYAQAIMGAVCGYGNKHT